MRLIAWKTSRGGHAVRARCPGTFSLICSLHAGDADLEELVEIRRHDAEKAQPLEQRHRRVLGLREHAPLELEHAELAIEEMALDVRG